MPLLVPYTSMIPYIPAGVHPPLQQQYPNYSNIVKTFANQNVCYTCRFDVEDWHTSATCNRKKWTSGWFHPFQLHGIRTHKTSILQESYAQNYVSQQLLMVWGGEYRYQLTKKCYTVLFIVPHS
jgi:hypothetical protein